MKHHMDQDASEISANKAAPPDTSSDVRLGMLANIAQAGGA